MSSAPKNVRTPDESGPRTALVAPVQGSLNKT